ncbi:MAG: cohesin domain-containing protein [Candidatus Poribacteria bacterium]
MKRIIITITILLLFLVSGYSYARNAAIIQGVSIDLKMGKQNLNVGDTMPVEVIIDQVSDLKGINILISFDSTKLKYVSISKGSMIEKFAEELVPGANEANANGKFEYLAALEGPGSGIESSGGTILTIIFSIKAPGDAWIKLLANDISMADSTANTIPTSIDLNQLTTNIGQIFELNVFNYPNPVGISGKTVIKCVSKAILEDLQARIYDISGELVKTIESSDFNTSQAPIYEYEWNCKNEKDQDVANGVYILWVKAKLGSDEKNQTWKIAILR